MREAEKTWLIVSWRRKAKQKPDRVSDKSLKDAKWQTDMYHMCVCVRVSVLHMANVPISWTSKQLTMSMMIEWLSEVASSIYKLSNGAYAQ